MDSGTFYGLLGLCAILWALWGELNGKVLEGVESDLSEVWSLVRFHVSLWVTISKTPCNYFIGIMLHS